VSWTKEKPNEPGFYWYYGHTRGHLDRDPELIFIKVKKIQNGVARVAGGIFLFDLEPLDGFFRPVDLPELPELPQ
jgi:hypothetical protein